MKSKLMYLTVIVIAFFFNCCTKKSETIFPLLTNTQLEAHQWKQFTGIYNGGIYSSSDIIFYSTINFQPNNNYSSIRQIEHPNFPPTYDYIPENGIYFYNESNLTITWPKVDTLIFGGTPMPFYRADWKLENKNDSMLFFRRSYTDTTKFGFYEPINSRLALKIK